MCVQVNQLMGKPLPRPVLPPRHLVLLETGWRYNIVCPPEASEGKVCGAIPRLCLVMALVCHGNVVSA